MLLLVIIIAYSRAVLG